MTIGTILNFTAIIVLVIGVAVGIKHFSQRQREEALSDILIMTGIELIISSFGTFDDKLFAFLSNTETETNYIQLLCGAVLLAGGIGFYLHIKNRLYILNINGYFDKRVEQHHKDLNLSSFEFKEREIDFIRLYKKGINRRSAKEIIEELTEKISTFKAESKDKKRAYTGIAPTPFIFIAGKLFSRERVDSYFEYDKINQTYYPLTICRKMRKPYSALNLVTPLNTINNPNSVQEVVLAISVTQQVQDQHLTQFSGVTIHMTINQPADNAIKYKDQLMSYTKAVYQLLIELSNRFPELKKIHLIYSGQSCLAFEIGKLIDDQRMAEITNYHYALNSTPKYPWGLVLNGNSKGTLIEL